MEGNVLNFTVKKGGMYCGYTIDMGQGYENVVFIGNLKLTQKQWEQLRKAIDEELRKK